MIKTAIYLSLGVDSIQDVQATGEAFSPQREHPALQKMKTRMKNTAINS
jgi:hypothetical protein